MAMTHKERKERRERIAEYCKTNSVQSACEHFGVTRYLILNACWENGVPTNGNRKVASASSFRILFRLMSGERGTDIAADTRVSKQRVAQIKKAGERAGFQFGQEE